MTVEKKYSCNVCTAERKEANHWFVGWITLQGFRIVEWEVAQQAGTLDDAGAVHICGQKCAHALLDQFLSHPLMALSGGQGDGSISA